MSSSTERVSFLEAGMAGRERRWHVGGPRGAVEAVVSEAPGFGRVIRIFLHVDHADGTPDARACQVTGRECWHQPVSAPIGLRIFEAWQELGEDEEVMFGALAELYAETLEDREED